MLYLKNNPYLFLILFFVVVCCSDSSSKNEQKFFSFNNYNWKSTTSYKSKNDISYTATIVPLEYYLLKNLGQNKNAVIDSTIKANEKERIIEVQFQHLEKKDLLKTEFTNKSYTESVKYISFSIEEDFYVVTSSNDTISCSGALFERNFKVAPFKRVLLYFNNIKPEDKIELVYQDKLFDNGTFKFKFEDLPIKL